MDVKKIIAASAAALLALGTFSALPADISFIPDISLTVSAADSDFVIKTDDEGVKYVAEYKGKGGNIRIPDGVKYVGNRSFYCNNDITGVTFPKSCTLVDGLAFRSCYNLEYAVFEGDAQIQIDGFQNCINLKKVEIKGSLWDEKYGEAINMSAFKHCQKLETFTVKGNKYAFTIDDYAFSGCYSLKKIDIGSKCKKIGTMAFTNCISLESITVPKNAELEVYEYSLGYFNIYNTKAAVKNSEWLLTLADGKKSTYIPYFSQNGKYSPRYGDDTQLNYDINKVTPVKLTMTVYRGSPAEKYAKENNIPYKYADGSSQSGKPDAPQGLKVTAADDTSITLSWSKSKNAAAYKVQKYDQQTKKWSDCGTFNGTKGKITGLDKNTVYIFKAVSLYTENGKYKDGDASGGLFAVTGSVKANKEYRFQLDENGLIFIDRYIGKGGDIVLPKGCYVGDNSFYKNDSITSLVFPEEYYVGDLAFANCDKLEKVVFESDATIDSEAFDGCSKLKTVEVKGSINGYIGVNAFASCHSLESFTVKKNQYSYIIQERAFSYCYSLKKVDIKDKCTDIYPDAFTNCISLKSITIPERTRLVEKYHEPSREIKYPLGFVSVSVENAKGGYDYIYEVPDGKTAYTFGVANYTELKELVPVKLTMTVTKGSDGERYAKKYGIAYKYKK